MFRHINSSVLRGASHRAVFISVLLLSLPFVSISAPVRSNLGGNGAENVPEQDYTIDDYVQDGLVAMWDGEFNAIAPDGEWFHDSTAPEWSDLVGGIDLTVYKTWSDKSLFCDGAYSMAIFSQPSPIANFQTVEVCFKTESEDLQFVYLDCGRRTCIGCYGTSVGVGLRQGMLLDYSSIDRNLTICSVYAGTSPTDNTSILSCANGMPLYRKGIGNWASPTGWYSVTIGSAYHSTTSCFKGHVYCIRMYSRALSIPEIYHNNEVDKARFGL